MFVLGIKGLSLQRPFNGYQMRITTPAGSIVGAKLLVEDTAINGDYSTVDHGRTKIWTGAMNPTLLCHGLKNERDQGGSLL
jgi:hypothetical protein